MSHRNEVSVVKTVVTKFVESELDTWQMGWWNLETEQFVPFTDTAEGTAAAKALGCSEQLIESLQMSLSDLIGLVRADLVTIWERLERIE
jgi:hypothetical protein